MKWAFHEYDRIFNGLMCLILFKPSNIGPHNLCTFLIRQPVPPADLADAQQYIRRYVEMCMELWGANWATPKNHWLLHILQDCENHGCHLERLSAYKFENRYSCFKRYLRQGNKPLEQIRLAKCLKFNIYD